VKVLVQICAVALVLLQLHSIRKDRIEWNRDKIADASPARLRRRLKWTWGAILIFLVFLTVILSTDCSKARHDLDSFSGVMYAIGISLTFVRSVITARREHQALRMAIVREIMES
jgi:hypothetical protein